MRWRTAMWMGGLVLLMGALWWASRFTVHAPMADRRVDRSAQPHVTDRPVPPVRTPWVFRRPSAISVDTTEPAELIDLDDLPPREAFIARQVLSANQTLWATECVSAHLLDTERRSISLRVRTTIDGDGLREYRLEGEHDQLPEEVRRCIDETLWGSSWPTYAGEGLLVNEASHLIEVHESVEQEDLESVAKGLRSQVEAMLAMQDLPQETFERRGFTVEVDDGEAQVGP